MFENLIKAVEELEKYAAGAMRVDYKPTLEDYQKLNRIKQLAEYLIEKI